MAQVTMRGGGELVDSEPPPVGWLWLVRVRADDLQIGTGAQVDEEIRGPHSLMTAAARRLRPCETGEPRDRLCQAARHRIDNVVDHDQASRCG